MRLPEQNSACALYHMHENTRTRTLLGYAICVCGFWGKFTG